MGDLKEFHYILVQKIGTEINFDLLYQAIEGWWKAGPMYDACFNSDLKSNIVSRTMVLLFNSFKHTTLVKVKMTILHWYTARG